MKTRCVVRGTWLQPSGFTLLEAVVVIVILGLVMGMSGLALVSLRAPRDSEVTRELRRARSEAIRTGRPTGAVAIHTPHTAHVLFLPDGRAIGTAADPLTGAPLDSAR